METLILEMDSLFLTNKHWLLGTWIANATSWSVNTDQVELYEFNAKNQVTMWGYDENINDYARKAWQVDIWNH